MFAAGADSIIGVNSREPSKVYSTAEDIDMNLLNVAKSELKEYPFLVKKY